MVTEVVVLLFDDDDDDSRRGGEADRLRLKALGVLAVVVESDVDDCIVDCIDDDGGSGGGSLGMLGMSLFVLLLLCTVSSCFVFV